MAATRVRFGSFLEWADRGGRHRWRCSALGSIVVREFRTVHAGDARHRRRGARTGSPAAGVPPRAVSVPMLLLRERRAGARRRPRVGRRSRGSARRGRSAATRSSAAPTANASTRFYDYRGARFVLVFEPFEPATSRGSRRSTCSEAPAT